MQSIQYNYERERLFPGFDKKTCKTCPQISYDGKDTAFLTYTILLLSGSDVDVGAYIAKSTDGGKTFGTPQPFHRIETNESGIRTIKGGGNMLYNRFHNKWMMIGGSECYEHDRHPMLVKGGGISVCYPYLSFLNPDTMELKTEVTPIPFPYASESIIPFGQLYELENGDVMVTFYYVPEGSTRAQVISVRYALKGNEFRIVQYGEPIAVGAEFARGVCEPSMAKLGDKYYMALRTDEVGMFAVSHDGYHFDKPRPWVWDDGTVLENYNTQQRWVRNSDGLFLVYTRKTPNNNHVFRNRAPLFMTRFDEDRQCLIRSEEIIAVPELGARLGNFTVTDVSSKEAWIVVAEWMQYIGCEKYGSDNSIWRTKILFQ